MTPPKYFETAPEATEIKRIINNMKNCMLKNNLDEMDKFPWKTPQTTEKDSRRNRISK